MAFPGRRFLRNLFSGRTLLIQLVKRDFAKRFVGSVAGWIWGLVHPLVQLAVWTFVFQVCLGQKPPPGESTDNYALFLFAGYLPWMLFQETVMRSATTLIENANLITKTVFPSEILPLTVFLSSMINHLLSLAIALVLIAAWEGGMSPKALLLPMYMFFLGLFAVGVGWIVSSLQVYLRDTAQILNVVMTLWFWVTPIFIGVELIPERLRFLVYLNPLAYLVKAYRDRLLSNRSPQLDELAVLAAYAMGTFLLGGLFFRHLKRGFADVL